ncbi:helix-turn-helix domain-containing protein [Caenispirillum bisanense]|uniref:Transcriptional regulator, AraC family n=1 Tax=Caenispirillum bisanense TaxID=414052 RepID=A0A286GWE2_9PROT|nr:helix-turn-helix domain-containing protein [Caenispirillum bisanense]SOD99840.1 transcriptional regulator, AraC family [Caenispirillum bisanense]
MDLLPALRPLAERLPTTPAWLGHGAAFSRIVTRRWERVGVVAPANPCLIAVLSGTKSVVRDGVDHRLTAPSLLLLAPDEAVTVVNEPDPASGLYLAVAVEFGPDTLRRIATRRLAAPARGADDLRVRPDRAVVEALVHALDGLTAPDGLSESVLEARVVELLTALVEAGHGRRLFARTLGDVAARVRSVLAVDPAAPATAATVAAALHMSVATLHRRLRAQKTGFQALRDAVRLDLATDRLAAGAPVKDVAAACGFASAGRFAAWFRSRTGRVPSAVRRPAA